MHSLYGSQQVSIPTIGANSQDQDVFVFNSSQTGLLKAKDSVAALKGNSKTASDESTTTRPPDQHNENAFNFVTQVNHTAQATAQTQRTKRQRYTYVVYVEHLIMHVDLFL